MFRLFLGSNNGCKLVTNEALANPVRTVTEVAALRLPLLVLALLFGCLFELVLVVRRLSISLVLRATVLVSITLAPCLRRLSALKFD